jgi:hypothetical protein
VATYSRPTPPADDYAASRAWFEAMITRLSEEETAAGTHEALEDYLTGDGRELQRTMMQDHLDACARREERRAQVVGADGVARVRAEPGHTRLLATTVGRVEVSRIAYRAAKASNLHPADAVRALPARTHSFPLQRAVVHEVADRPLRSARESLARTTGQQLGTRQLQEITVEAARDVRDFYAQHTAPDPAPAPGTEPEPAPGTGGRDLLVLSIDATGVNMIPSGLRTPAPPRPAGPQPPSAQLSTRERTGRTRMACVTACYDVRPAPRSAADILPRDAAERAARRDGPVAKARRMDASLEHSTAAMTTALFDQAEQRDPAHQRRWVVLVDGANHQLDCIEKEAGKRGVDIDIIVDFVHVLEYLWKAADDLHPDHGTRAAFVQSAARDLLEGHAPRLVADLHTHQRTRIAHNRPAPGLDRAAAYLEAKLPYLDYHIALTLGWPIATGVIEGSCRYLVKDRLDVTGARWSLPGGEAVLLLRTVIANGDFPEYWRYHVLRDHQRTHQTLYQNQLDIAA